MSGWQIALMSATITVVMGYLFYLAKRQDDSRRAVAAAKEQRLASFVDRYRRLVGSAQSANLLGMLAAGVLSLADSEEIWEVCRRIEAEGLTPGIPPTYLDDLKEADVIQFFRLYSSSRSQPQSDALVRRLIQQSKGTPVG